VSDYRTTIGDGAPSNGLGLRNVAERLRTIYGFQGTLVVQSIFRGGSRATVQMPAGEIAW
jgi:LytS/YehU family sensor histidine kinase